jgi:hypothetical protein
VQRTALTMAETVGFASGDAAAWRAALAAYDRRLAALDKTDLVAVDSFYRHDLPALLRCRDPDPFLAKPELVRLLQWKLSRGKWRSVHLPFFNYHAVASLFTLQLLDPIGRGPVLASMEIVHKYAADSIKGCLNALKLIVSG